MHTIELDFDTYCALWFVLAVAVSFAKIALVRWSKRKQKEQDEFERWKNNEYHELSKWQRELENKASSIREKNKQYRF